MYQDLVILGATGKVGSRLFKHLFERKDNDSNYHENPTRVVGLSRKGSWAYSERGFRSDGLEGFKGGEIRSQSFEKFDEILYNMQLHYSGLKNRNLTFIDCTSLGKEMLGFYKKVLRETNFNIVTSNKNPLVSCDFKTFQELIAKPPRFGYGCSVMAGAGIVNEIKYSRDLNDEILKVEGCLSGTLGFICYSIQNGLLFSKALEEAINLGYTETDYLIDLRGKDALNKIIILSRTAGYNLLKKSILHNPFVDKKYLGSIGVLHKNMNYVNEYFFKRNRNAARKGKVLRYIASFDPKKLSIGVGPREVDKDGEFGILKGAICRTSLYIPETVIPIECAGAGLDVTARNIRKDLVDQLTNRVLRK
ncbi:hypothetical protein J4408_00010 [Candidatus Pacearchaeota archaeon]|nr:hypothetical protein [Candidatus Pacearchaeota archaeon]